MKALPSKKATCCAPRASTHVYGHWIVIKHTQAHAFARRWQRPENTSYDHPCEKLRLTHGSSALSLDSLKDQAPPYGLAR